jgi:choloylglycine hydrolase
MCTAATYKTGDFYFGRTLDYEHSYGEEIAVTPRNFPLRFRHMGTLDQHLAIIGMACVAEGYPLYFDAINEKGLGMAGLNFTDNAFYGKCLPDKENITVFEFVPWVLSQCASVDEARALLKDLQLTDTPFSPEIPAAQLHWIIADHKEAITVEAVADGLHVYDNPVGVLSNNPPFPLQMFRLNDHMHLTSQMPRNLFSDQLPLVPYSRGMGALGLPGDGSSVSRFVRAAFVKSHGITGESEEESVNQFFHILGAVEQIRGCCAADDGYVITHYTSCCNLSRGIYYYTTYDNHQITAVDMHREDLTGSELICYKLREKEQILLQNGKEEGE